ncbi:hypothetical protein [Prosthecochloris sp.]|uniref:hypothetical protein n=1 Tax=Prosthecochloris sp. TaxID=290513 RepID=UPI0025FADE21|nr:hypothetical protein [Prosthecochloris sp.]
MMQNLNIKKTSTPSTHDLAVVAFVAEGELSARLQKYTFAGPGWVEAKTRKGVMLRIYWGKENGLPPFQAEEEAAKVFVRVIEHEYEGRRTTKVIFSDRPSPDGTYYEEMAEAAGIALIESSIGASL